MSEFGYDDKKQIKALRGIVAIANADDLPKEIEISIDSDTTVYFNISVELLERLLDAAERTP